MGSLLRTILIFAIVYYLFKKVGGFFYRTVAGSPDPQSGNSSQQRGGFNNQGSQSRMGEIRVEKNPTQGKKSGADFKGGEYVDFEEVD